MPAITLICRTDNQRLDRFLAQSLPELSRSRAQQLIAAGLVQAGALKLKAATPLPAGTEVTVTLLPAESPPPAALPLPLNILFEDETILVVNKPAGLVTHPGTGHAQDTLVNALLYHRPELAHLHPERPGIVHRLDKDTSGALMVAKTTAALEALQQQFRARSVEKIYLALVHGRPVSPTGIIDVPLGRHPQQRQRFAPLQEGKPARTHYAIEQVFEDYSLLTVKLETGRTHQIRVHLAWLGYPVAGDKVYGRRKTGLPLARQFLHASRLTVDHPLSGERLTFSAPLPPDLQAVLDSLA